jgi:hypothetical protein
LRSIWVRIVAAQTRWPNVTSSPWILVAGSNPRTCRRSAGGQVQQPQRHGAIMSHCRLIRIAPGRGCATFWNPGRRQCAGVVRRVGQTRGCSPYPTRWGGHAGRDTDCGLERWVGAKAVVSVRDKVLVTHTHPHAAVHLWIMPPHPAPTRARNSRTERRSATSWSTRSSSSRGPKRNALPCSKPLSMPYPSGF